MPCVWVAGFSDPVLSIPNYGVYCCTPVTLSKQGFISVATMLLVVSATFGGLKESNPLWPLGPWVDDP